MKPGRKKQDLTGKTFRWLYVSAKLETGEYLCICSKNGCGKTRIVSHVSLMVNRIKQCVDCAQESRQRVAIKKGESLRKSGPRVETGGLTTRRLTREQRVVFEAIMHGHKVNSETRNEALGMVNRATKNGTLAEELAYWTEPCGSETHQSSSLAAAIAFGMREGAGA